MEEDYRGLPEDYKGGGFQGPERKRRGVCIDYLDRRVLSLTTTLESSTSWPLS